MSEKDYGQQLMAPYAVLGVRGDSETLGYGEIYVSAKLTESMQQAFSKV